tara:strand:+ start:651 stop:1019 length:369 start_codon:yes stop_codon:yes gene_type:complete
MKSFKEFRENVEIKDAQGNLYATIIDIVKPDPIQVPKSSVNWEQLIKETTLPRQRGNIVYIRFLWRNKWMYISMFFPQVRTRKPTRDEVDIQLQKVYPGAKLSYYEVSNYEPGQPLIKVGDD